MQVMSVYKSMLIMALIAATLSAVVSVNITGAKINFFVLPVIFIATFGLWKFKRWARNLYTLITVISIGFYPVLVDLSSALLTYSAPILELIVIGMIFIGTLSEKFNKIIQENS